jgi:hypothetical protein
MAVYGNSFESALQFVGVQRFCVNVDASLKQLLCTWGGILNARAMVAKDRGPPGTNVGAPPLKSTKRGIQDATNGEDETLDQGEDPTQDRERFCGRKAFMPFHDLAPEG